MEFFAAANGSSIIDTDYNLYAETHARISKLLQESGLEVGSLQDGMTYEAQQYCRDDYSKWNVKTEVLDSDNIVFGGSGNGERQPVPAEVISRILTVDRASSEEIPSALAAIKQGFDLAVNHHCGLHIHVSSVAGFSFQTLQNLALLVVGFEAAINSYHDKHRCTKAMCKTPSAQLGLSNEQTVHGRLQVIRGLNSKSALLKRLTLAGRWNAYNFENLRRASRGKPTVEFRQHIATVDPKTILAWARFVTSLVKFAAEVSPPELDSLLEYADDPSFSILHLADAIGCPDLRDAWKGHQWNFDSRAREQAHLASVGDDFKRRHDRAWWCNPLHYRPFVTSKPFKVEPELFVGTHLERFSKDQLQDMTIDRCWARGIFIPEVADTPLGQSGRIFRQRFDEASTAIDGSKPTRRVLPKSKFCPEPEGWTLPSDQVGHHSFADRRLREYAELLMGHRAGSEARQSLEDSDGMDEYG